MRYQYLIYSMDFSLYKGADLANMVNVAAIYAASEGDASVSTKHLEFAKDKIIMGKFGFTLSLICLCFSFFFFCLFSIAALSAQLHELQTAVWEVISSKILTATATGQS